MKESQAPTTKPADSHLRELAKVLAQTRSSLRLTAIEEKVSEQITRHQRLGWSVSLPASRREACWSG